jgi:hypothetical protein
MDWGLLGEKPLFPIGADIARERNQSEVSAASPKAFVPLASNEASL